MNRRAFLSSAAGISLAGLAPAAAVQAQQDAHMRLIESPKRFKVSGDRSQYSVSYDMGRTFHHAMKLPNSSVLSDLQTSGSEYRATVALKDVRESFTLRSLDGYTWYSLPETAALALRFPSNGVGNIAGIVMFGGNFAVREYALCEGQLLPVSSNQALFSLIGTLYGGDGRTTFGVPDLRSRMPVHFASLSSSHAYGLGQTGGSATNTLTVAQLPAHSHSVTVNAANGEGDSDQPKGNYWARSNQDHYASSSDETMHSSAVQVADAGSGAAVNNMPPYLAINFQMALQGIFPARN